MSGLFSLRHLTTAAILMSAVGCTVLGQTMSASAPASSPATTGPAMPPAGTMPDPNAPIATINGQPLNNKAFYDILMQVAGMRVFPQILDLYLVQRECLEAGIPLSGDSFAKRMEEEFNRTLDGLNVKAEEGKPELTRDQKIAALNSILQQQGMTGVEFRLGQETRAELRALSEGGNKIEVTQAEIDDAFQSEYGAKRKIHILQYPKNISSLDIKRDLNTKKPDGTLPTPEEVAAKLKLPAPAIWTISKNARNVEPISSVAFGLAKVGDISAETDVPVNANKDTQKVLIILDEIIPDKTGGATQPSASVAKELRDKVYDYKQGQWMQGHLQILRANAKVEVKDPILSQIYAQMAEAIKKQQEAAATQSSSAPASMPAVSTRPASR